MMTAIDQKAAAREHRREVLNTVIDLLESLPDQQERTDVIVSAAAAVSVKIVMPTTSAIRNGYASRRKYAH